jgi:chorismate mutase-like protein
MEILKPYRAQIDRIDDQIIDLLAARLDVIRTVGDLKARENIPSYLRDRVNEVQARCADRAKGKGVDPDLVKSLYTLLIDYSCALEEKIIAKK